MTMYTYHSEQCIVVCFVARRSSYDKYSCRTKIPLKRCPENGSGRERAVIILRQFAVTSVAAGLQRKLNALKKRALYRQYEF